MNIRNLILAFFFIGQWPCNIFAQDHEELFDAIYENDYEQVKKLTDKATINKPEPSSWTPLQYAARFGNKAIMTHLINSGANVNVTSGKMAPLCNAIMNDKLSAVRVLLKANANVNIPCNVGYSHDLRELSNGSAIGPVTEA